MMNNEVATSCNNDQQDHHIMRQQMRSPCHATMNNKVATLNDDEQWVAGLGDASCIVWPLVCFFKAFIY